MFDKLQFSPEQVDKYYQTAVRDLHLATSIKIPELVFDLCYKIIIKIAIAVCAYNNLRVKSRVGHHIELINKLAEYLKNPDIEIIAERMRTKRNKDLYDGGRPTSEKEANFYLIFCQKLIKQADTYLFHNKLQFSPEQVDELL